MGDGGAAGLGESPYLASKKPIPSPRAKNQGPSKNFREKRGKLRVFFKKYLFLALAKIPVFSCRFILPSPPPLYPSPRKGKSTPSPRAILGGVTFFDPRLEKSRRPCVAVI